MTLTAADVAEIMRLVESSSFDELSLELNGMKLHLRRGGPAANGTPTTGATVAGTASTGTPTAGAAAAGTASTGTPTSGTPTPPPAAPTHAGPALHQVTAPLLGTFYRAPKPGAPPFVEPGSPVEPDTLIAIIEVMKLMNSVRAGVHGTVVDILPTDGALVEYGETLLRVARSD